MNSAIQLISTDFDGTFFAEFEKPPVPATLQRLIGQLQTQGAKWVINTGRDLSSLLETMTRAHLSVEPDFLVTVEREIHCHEGSRYVSHLDWNRRCSEAHEELFIRVKDDLPKMIDWVNARFDATIYEDSYSPFCLLAGNNADADAIVEFLTWYCGQIPNLTVMRNDVYARLSHKDYNKGTALAEIARLLNLSRDHTLAAGDHLNDLPMLSLEFAAFLVAPANAVPAVKETVLHQAGYVSNQPWGFGLERGLEYFLNGHPVQHAALNPKPD